MRRNIVVGIVGLALGVAVALAIVAANLDRYIERNRDWIAQRIEAAVGRPVRFARLGVSLRGGVGVHVDELRVGDDPAYARDDFLRVGSARVVVALLPALRGRWEVKRLVLDEPSVTVIRDARGLNLSSLAPPPAEGGKAGAQ